MAEKSGWSERKESFLGDKYTQYYDEDGNKTSKSEAKEDIWGNKYTQYYDQRESKISPSSSGSSDGFDLRALLALPLCLLFGFIVMASVLDACNIVPLATSMRLVGLGNPIYDAPSEQVKSYDSSSKNLRAFVVTQNNSGLHLRSEKSPKSSSVIFVPEGSEVTILYYDQQQAKVNGRVGRWCRARYNGLEGWAWGWYLEVR